MSETEARSARGESPVEGYDGPGAWGRWALVLLVSLFLISAIATVHSILVTFGGG